MARSHALRKKARFNAALFQEKLLGWYGKYRRDLPWRAHAGKKPDPYHVWLSEIMLQQTTVQAVIPYFEKFISRWPSIKALAAADPDDVMQAWAGLGYYARARNLLKCAAQICAEYDGVFPSTECDLLKLPGIGPYTSAAISAIAFNKQATVIDGNVERVVARSFLITDPLPQSKPAIKEKAHILFQDVSAPGDFAQALMDLGATICIPQSPRCGVCPVRDICKAYAQGIQSELPAKSPKKTRPKRIGTVFWLRTRDGSIVVEKRAETRMMGGMPGLPTTDWDASGHEFRPAKKTFEALRDGGVVHHTFTHFDLTLNVVEAEIDVQDLPETGNWMFICQSDIRKLGFPSLFKKVVKLKESRPDRL
jgi:A/G-specific adenine glycosylase